METSRRLVPDSMSVSRINEKDDSPRRLVIFFVFLPFYSNSVLKPESGMVGESMMNDAAEWVERNGPL